MLYFQVKILGFSFMISEINFLNSLRVQAMHSDFCSFSAGKWVLFTLQVSIQSASGDKCL